MGSILSKTSKTSNEHIEIGNPDSISKSPLIKQFKKAKRMMRIELLQFLEFSDIIKLISTCREMYHLIDSQ
jgi:hypothetical protein